MDLGMALIDREIPDTVIRARVAAINAAVAVTTDDLVIAATGLRTQDSALRRYPLKSLTGIRCLEDSRGSILALEFGSSANRVLLFAAEAQPGALELVSLLQCPVKKVVQLPPTRAREHVCPV
jgi:hypothetical protein